VSMTSSGPEGHLPVVVPLARYWRERPGTQALNDFIGAFDGTLNALRLKLCDRHGREIAASMPLHQQVSFAGEFGIWSAGELAGWRQCLALRAEILTEGRAVPSATLAQHTGWLKALALRTGRCRVS
jgi:hypothetical protein